MKFINVHEVQVEIEEIFLKQLQFKVILNFQVIFVTLFPDYLSTIYRPQILYIAKYRAFHV